MPCCKQLTMPCCKRRVTRAALLLTPCVALLLLASRHRHLGSVHRLDLAAASKLDTSREVPILDVRPANAPSDWQPGGRQGGAEAPAASASA